MRSVATNAVFQVLGLHREERALRGRVKVSLKPFDGTYVNLLVAVSSIDGDCLNDQQLAKAILPLSPLVYFVQILVKTIVLVCHCWKFL